MADRPADDTNGIEDLSAAAGPPAASGTSRQGWGYISLLKSAGCRVRGPVRGNLSEEEDT
jgi:hypothetical protein